MMKKTELRKLEKKLTTIKQLLSLFLPDSWDYIKRKSWCNDRN